MTSRGHPSRTSPPPPDKKRKASQGLSDEEIHDEEQTVSSRKTKKTRIPVSKDVSTEGNDVDTSQPPGTSETNEPSNDEGEDKDGTSEATELDGRQSHPSSKGQAKLDQGTQKRIAAGCSFCPLLVDMRAHREIKPQNARKIILRIQISVQGRANTSKSSPVQGKKLLLPPSFRKPEQDGTRSTPVPRLLVQSRRQTLAVGREAKLLAKAEKESKAAKEAQKNALGRAKVLQTSRIPCPTCDKSYATPGTLLRHQTSQHHPKGTSGKPSTAESTESIEPGKGPKKTSDKRTEQQVDTNEDNIFPGIIECSEPSDFSPDPVSSEESVVDTTEITRKHGRQRIDGNTEEGQSTAVKKKSKNQDLAATKQGIAQDLPPLSNLKDIFEDMAKKAVAQGFDVVTDALRHRKLRVATICSGTESPLLALDQIDRGLKRLFGTRLRIDHVFSCEISPLKQAYIERNFHPPLIFRDVMELDKDEASTAYAGKHKVPGNITVLIAGFSCVDFSRLNKQRSMNLRSGESTDTLQGILRYAAKFRPTIIILENVQSAPWETIAAAWENDQEYYEKRIDSFQNVWAEGDLAYSTRYVIVNSKDYYIPQTRNRGYMICIDNTKCKKLGHKANELLNEWELALTGQLRAERAPKGRQNALIAPSPSLKRPVSSSMEHFMLQNDDAHVVKLRSESTISLPGEQKIKRDIAWTSCQSRYEVYRIEKNLGMGRPITRWSAGGTCTIPDYMWRRWMASKVDRIRDTFEICALRVVRLHGYDGFWKSRCWELSQNVDRWQDANNLGIIGCITPTGEQFLTTRGGPVTGLELLMLQAIPVNSISLSRETDRELQDLAGNAMTSTVVGAAVLCALKAGLPLLGFVDKGNYIEADEAWQCDEAVNESFLGSFGGFKGTNGSKANLVSLAHASTLRCYCENYRKQTAHQILKCKICGHTACDDCGKTPAHDYENFVDTRVEPKCFDESIQAALPMRIQLSGLTVEDLNKFEVQHSILQSTHDWPIYKKAIEACLGEELRFRSTAVSDRWKITYEGQRSRLELVFSNGNTKWVLFAKVDPTESNGSRVRALLDHPFARMIPPNGAHLIQGPWSLCLPITKEFTINIKGEGSRLPSYQQRLGLQKLESHEENVHQHLRISVQETEYSEAFDELQGVYDAAPDCGMAMGSMYRKRGDTKKANSELFFFLDPTTIGLPSKDQFSFSRDKHRLRFGEVHDVVAKVEAAFRLANKDLNQGSTTQKCEAFGEWHRCPGALKPLDNVNPPIYKVIDEKPKIRISAGTQNKDFEVDDQSLPACNRELVALLSCVINLDDVEVERWRNFASEAMDKDTAHRFFEECTFLTVPARMLGGFSPEYRPLIVLASRCRCYRCAPESPPLKWTPRKTSSSAANSSLVPFEDGTEAGKVEQILRARPSAFSIQPTVLNKNTVKLLVGLNLQTMVHRLLARCPKPLATGADGSQGCKSAASQSEGNIQKRSTPRASIHNSLGTNVHQLSDLPGCESHVRDTYLDYDHSKTLPSNKTKNPQKELYISQGRLVPKRQMEEQEDVEPTKDLIVEWSLRTAYDPTREIQLQPFVLLDNKFDPAYEISLPGGCQLLDDQKRSLHWAIQREVRSPENEFMNLEIEEAVNQELHYRAEVRARWRDLVLGGVLADEVGYGKTAVILALIYAQTGRSKKHATTTIPGRKAIKATLIDVPSSIAQQWSEQKKKFLGTALNVVLIRDVTDLQRMTFKQWVDADIVIFSKSVYDSDTYWTLVSEQACLPKGPSMGGRAFSAWYARAAANIAKHVDELLSGDKEPNDLARIFKERLIKAHEDSLLNEEIPTQRFKGAKYTLVKEAHKRAQEGNNPEEKAKEGHENEPDKVIKAAHNGSKARYVGLTGKQRLDDVTCCLPIWFGFSRVVVDEFTYVNDKHAPAIHGLSAAARWVLSGTTPLEDFADVRLIASFLGIRLGVEDDAVGVLRHDHIQRIRKERTLRESFLAFTESRTPDWHESNQLHAQAFLDQFARQNAPNLKGISCVEIEMPIQLMSYEKVINMELHQQIASHDYRLLQGTNTNTNQDSDRMRRMFEVMGNARTVEEALIRRAAYCEGATSLNDIIAVRGAEMKALMKEFKLLLRKTVSMVEEVKKAKLDKAQPLGPHWKKFYASVNSDLSNFGDLATLLRVRELVEKSIDGYKPEHKWQFFYKAKPGAAPQVETTRTASIRDQKLWDAEMRLNTRTLRGLVDDMIGRQRGFRFMQSVGFLSRYNLSKDRGARFHCCNELLMNFAPATTFVLGSCGHLICRVCLVSAETDLRTKAITCPVDGCNASAATHFQVGAQELRQTHDAVPRHYGSKLDTIIGHIKYKIPEDDQVLVFVQYEETMAKFSEAFKDQGISHYAIRRNQSAREKQEYMKDFQDNVQQAKKQKVLLLNSSDESAAGANLTNANHIIFVSPLNAESKQQYLAQMKQAIGRARRYGQEKALEVHHSSALNTIDVDIRQKHEEKYLVAERRYNKDPEWHMVHGNDRNEMQKQEDWSSGFYDR